MKYLHALSAIAIAVAALGLPLAAQAQEAKAELFFEGDMVRGRSQDGATGPTCVLTSEFKRQEHVVWRIRVLDPASGEQLDDKGLQSVSVEIPGGDKFEARFGTHPRRDPTDRFWATSWGIPADYPTGSIGYKIVAVDLDGKPHEWTPFNVASSQLKVIPGDVEFTKN